jgi:uncharacterized repeat protein (TIGR03803 family)
MHSTFRSLAFAALSLSLSFIPLPVHGQTESVVLSFTGTNGETPSSTLIFDSAGNLYGTTVSGGDISTSCQGNSANGCGTVFKLSRDHTGTWRETVLHQFEPGRGGSYATGPVIQDAAGNLYGTTRYGGLANGCGGGGCGVVYKLSQSSGVWRETVLHTFSGPDGEFPLSGVIMDASGNLYGTASLGGNVNDCTQNTPPGCGVVFELSPMAGGGWKETVLYAFTGAADGGIPSGGLVFDTAGSLYGTTSLYGGSNFGTVFELSPSSSGWTLTTLDTFTGATSDGAYPGGTLIFDAAGNLYGTTYQGGSGGGIGSGTVFELSPSSGSWAETVLHNFALNPDGGEPIAGVVFDAKGNLWGTTSSGGPDGHFSTGVVYELVPGSGGTWTYVGAHDFRQGIGDGQYPYGGVVFDKSGNVYGTTAFGGSANLGAFYKIVP